MWVGGRIAWVGRWLGELVSEIRRGRADERGNFGHNIHFCKHPSARVAAPSERTDEYETIEQRNIDHKLRPARG